MRAKAVRLTLRLVDLSISAAVLLSGASILLARRGQRRRSVPSEQPRLMALDSMYSLSALRARQAEHLITYRDLDGYFDHVWSVHPLVGAHRGEPLSAGFGLPTVTSLSPAHTMVEGKIRRFRGSAFPYLNFALAQVQLVLLLEQIVRREGVGIVRGDPYYNGLLAVLLARLGRRAVELRIIADRDAIYEAVGSLVHPRLFRSRRVEQRVARFTLSRAQSVVLGTPVYREFALRNGARSQRLAIVGNWSMINPVHLEDPREREPLEDEFGLGDRPIAVCVSRLEAMKHPQDFVVSIAKARLQDPRLVGLLVGDGAMRSELEQLCAELGVEDHVVFAGDRTQGWIARMLPRCTVVVAPLAGLALVESALSATPIAAYEVEWHSELIVSGRDGLLVPDRDTDALAAAIRELVDDPARGAQIAAAARARALAMMRPAELLAHERALADELLRFSVSNAVRHGATP